LTAQEIDTYMNKKSGIARVSGVSSDFRDLSAAAAKGNERAALARKMFCYKVHQIYRRLCGNARRRGCDRG
jgi:acetate kinase